MENDVDFKMLEGQKIKKIDITIDSNVGNVLSIELGNGMIYTLTFQNDLWMHLIGQNGQQISGSVHDNTEIFD